jgi:hypothetical protein
MYEVPRRETAGGFFLVRRPCPRVARQFCCGLRLTM